MKLQKLFKIGVLTPLLFLGCTEHKVLIKQTYIKIKMPTIERKITIPKDVTFKIRAKNENYVIISKKSLKELLNNYVYMRNELQEVQKQDIIFNKHIERINNEQIK